MKKVFAVFLALTLLLSMVAVCFAAPSIENKKIEIAEVEGHEAIIELPDGEKEFADKDSMLELVITPYTDKELAMIQEIDDELTNAAQQVTDAADVSQLTTKILEALEKTNQAMGTSLQVGDLEVMDLFDAMLVKDKIQMYEAPDGSSITFAVKTNLRPGDIFFILENADGDFWDVVENITLSEDGLLIITVKKLGVFAIILGSQSDVVIDPRGPRSPQTGYGASDFLWIGAAICGAAAIIVTAACSVGKRRKKA